MRGGAVLSLGEVGRDLTSRLRRMGVEVHLVDIEDLEGAADVPEASFYVVSEKQGITASRRWAAVGRKPQIRRTITWGPRVSGNDVIALDGLGIGYVCNSGASIDQLVRLVAHVDANAVLDARERLQEARDTAQSIFIATTAALDVFPEAKTFDAPFFDTLCRGFVRRMRDSALPILIDEIFRNQETTIQHCSLVTTIAVAFGNKLGLSSSDSELLFHAAFFHDIGKSVIPRSIIDKPGRLTDEEMRLVRNHSSVGHSLLQRFPETTGEVADVALHHHEFLDGSGYPFGLKGKEIPDLVRLVTISDIFAAMIERRAYKPSKSSAEAYATLRSMDGKLDQDLVRVFESVAEVFDIQAIAA